MRFEAKDGEATIWIYDAIGELFGPDAVTAKGVRDRLQSLRGIERLTVRINSPGGVVDDAVAINTLLNEYAATKTTKIDGIAASAATLVIPQGSVQMAKGAKMMIHNPWTVAVGNYRDLEHAAKVAKQYAQSAAEMYAARTGKPIEDIQAAMDAETYYLDQEAVDFGLADSVGDGEAVQAASHEAIVAKAKICAQLAFAELVGKSAEQLQSTFNAMAQAAGNIANMRRRVALAKARYQGNDSISAVD